MVFLVKTKKKLKAEKNFWKLYTNLILFSVKLKEDVTKAGNPVGIAIKPCFRNTCIQYGVSIDSRLLPGVLTIDYIVIAFLFNAV